MTPAVLLGLVWFAAVVVLLVRVLLRFRTHRAVSIEVPQSNPPMPSVSVIVPVRNEAANIGDCLDALSAQRGTAGRVRIIVVDDGSQDRTAAVVRERIANGVPATLISAGLLPPGWMGKPHACWQGALASESDWLCFVDADVRASPDLIRAAITAAQAQAVDMLSLHAFQELGSFFERLIVPAGILMIACVEDLRRVTDATCPDVTANGQFILIRRDAYFVAEGHAAVRDRICEDKALAARVKQAGLRLQVLAGENLLRTRMYKDLRSLWEGFSKNAVDILGSAPGTLAAAAGGIAASVAAPLAPALAVAAAISDPSVPNFIAAGLATAATCAVLAVQAGTLRYFRVPLGYLILLPAGLMLASAIAIHSVTLRSRGSVTWKGRRYEFERHRQQRG